MEEKTNHISEFLYAMQVDENGQIPCTIMVDGIERTFEITERDARAFYRMFEYHKQQNKDI